MLKILQARLQQYVSRELPDVQAGFRKGRRTRDQIANTLWITEKAREFQKNINFCHKGGVICISEVIDISPGNLDSSLCYFESSVSLSPAFLMIYSA